ncbi:MAG: sulfotransferase domain-containing protein [Saprospiraceae bacterium]|nr:sulfotransferase domain-containing protein [Saprospiraceae bacterium]
MASKKFPNAAPLHKKILFQTVYRWTASWRRKPDFIIIGVQKGGTSSLFRYLEQHPDTKMPYRKQLHFFDRSFNKGLRFYQQAFPLSMFSKGKITGEATPFYVFHPRVAERMHQVLPDVKLILMLRNPIDRAYSHYQMKKDQGWEDAETFEEALGKEKVRLATELAKMEADPNYYSKIYRNFGYLSRGNYAEQLEKWLKYFPKEQILILESEEFFSKPMDSLERVYAFLGMKSFRPPSLKAFNSREYDPLDPALREKLQNHFRPYNEKLAKMLDWPIDWK